MGSDEDQFRRLAGQNALKRWSEFLKHIMNGRNNNGDILIGELGLVCDRFGLVRPVAYTVNEQSKVAMNPDFN